MDQDGFVVLQSSGRNRQCLLTSQKVRSNKMNLNQIKSDGLGWICCASKFRKKQIVRAHFIESAQQQNAFQLDYMGSDGLGWICCASGRNRQCLLISQKVRSNNTGFVAFTWLETNDRAVYGGIIIIHPTRFDILKKDCCLYFSVLTRVLQKKMHLF